MGLFFNKNMKVLHSSDNVLMIIKEFDLKINSNNNAERTVQTLLKKQFPSLANPKLFHEFYFPQRLDYATSGVMCIPKTKDACRVVSSSLSSRTARKYYIALVRGLISCEYLDVNISIGEDTRFKVIQKMCTANTEFCTKPRQARTKILVLEEGTYDDYPATKILVRPITGRRHQIRVHCSYLGHSIVGDYTYSERKDVTPYRMFLHSFRMVLPMSIEYVDVQTREPFLDEDKWCSFRIINKIDDSAFDKLECVNVHCDGTEVR
ncbi:hypothetical protein JTB14_006629 [Gonioctena quinquepunctata]|nr:hypothetical protein JTB14_006629 [Gonioctena quinquepunctata]